MSVSKTRLLIMTDLIPDGQENAVTVRHLRDDLATLPGFNGLDTTMRTIQRDLLTLSKVPFSNKRLLCDHDRPGMTAYWYWERKV